MELTFIFLIMPFFSSSYIERYGTSFRPSGKSVQSGNKKGFTLTVRPLLLNHGRDYRNAPNGLSRRPKRYSHRYYGRLSTVLFDRSIDSVNSVPSHSRQDQSSPEHTKENSISKKGKKWDLISGNPTKTNSITSFRMANNSHRGGRIRYRIFFSG
jgi:hypothetical protein